MADVPVDPNAALRFVPCPACQRGDHEECWQVDPPWGIPIITCPCRDASWADMAGPEWWTRFVVVTSVGPVGQPGWAVFDRLDHRTKGGWFADAQPARLLADEMNGPSAAEIAAAQAALRSVLAML